MNYKFLTIILGCAVVIFAIFSVAMIQKPDLLVKIPATEVNHLVQKNKVSSALQAVPSATTTISEGLVNDFLNSKFRVLSVVHNPAAYSDSNTLSQLINQVELVVATDKNTPDQQSQQYNDTACGSIYTKPDCYFFYQPLYVYGAPKQAKYIGDLKSQGAFDPASVKFISPDIVEFQTGDGDAGYGYVATWNLSLTTGEFKQISKKEFNSEQP